MNIPFSRCPHCGGTDLHVMVAYPCDQRTKVWWCSVLKGCGWHWCKLWGKWYMAPSFAALEDPGGVEIHMMGEHQEVDA